MTDDKRITKSTAEYVEKSTKLRQRCGNCEMFLLPVGWQRQKPNACTLVKGNIAPGGWCKFWERS